MPFAPAPVLPLRAGDRERLEAVIRKRTSPQRDVQRARIILCCADGLAHRRIKRELHTSVDTILRWRSRYEQEGLDGIVEPISRLTVWRLLDQVVIKASPLALLAQQPRS